MLWAMWAAVSAPPYVQIGGVVYTRERTFQVPVELTRDEESRAAAVRLWASSDGGKTWERKREQSPRKPFIRFAATADGAYDLALAVIGTNGRQEPARPEDLQSGLKIVVDTVPPKPDAEIVESADGRRGLQWQATDACPAALLRADVAVFVEGQGWQPCAAAKGGRTCWFRPGDRIVRAQVHVRDAAGNAATIELELNGENFRTKPVENYALTPSAPAPGELDRAFASRGKELAAAAPSPIRKQRSDADVQPASFTAAPAMPVPPPAAVAAPPAAAVATPPAATVVPEPAAPTPVEAQPAPMPPPPAAKAPAPPADGGWKPRRKS